MTETDRSLYIAFGRSQNYFPDIRVQAVLVEDEDVAFTHPRDLEGGFSIRYLAKEIAVLGNGDQKLGVAKIFNAIADDGRSLEERAMDSRRPLQDELDILLPPPSSIRLN